MNPPISAKSPVYDERLMARLWIWMNASPGRRFSIERLTSPSQSIRILLDDCGRMASFCESWQTINNSSLDLLRFHVERMIDALAKQAGRTNATVIVHEDLS